jgi:Domain of unknown function (DUF5615)
MRFLADENFRFPAVAALRDRGHDVSSIADDHAGSSDELVAEICDRDARILLTFDKDFGDLVFRRILCCGTRPGARQTATNPEVPARVIMGLGAFGSAMSGANGEDTERQKKL